jgi:hypothetical protein
LQDLSICELQAELEQRNGLSFSVAFVDAVNKHSAGSAEAYNALDELEKYNAEVVNAKKTVKKLAKLLEYKRMDLQGVMMRLAELVSDQ